MTSESRDSAGFPPLAGSARPGPVTDDLEQAADSALIDLISRGSKPAFAVLFDRTSEAACAELMAEIPSAVRRNEIFAASYVEVWWLAGCHRTPEIDARRWIVGIVRRRIDEARGGPRHGEHAVWEGPRPSYAELELAGLLRRPPDVTRRA